MKVVNLPLSTTEDRLIGALDIEQVLKKGIQALRPGILAEANQNVLYVDEINLLPDHMTFDPKLQLLPIGDVDPGIMDKLASMLEDQFQNVEVLKPMPLIKSSYNPNRDQYLCNDFLRKTKRMTDGLVLGVTEVDLYTYDLNFVFGQAELQVRLRLSH